MFDVTFSMYSGIDRLKTNIQNFTTALASSGIDYRNGLVTYRDVPDITKVVDDTDGSPNYPSFSADGSRLYYDRYHSTSWADLQYTPLADYAPVTFNQKINFLADGYYNRTPALPPPVLPEFFPLVP